MTFINLNFIDLAISITMCADHSDRRAQIQFKYHIMKFQLELFQLFFFFRLSNRNEIANRNEFSYFC